MVFVKTKVTFPTPARETADIPQNFINFAVPWPFTFPMPPVETSGLAVGTTRPCPPAQSRTLCGLFRLLVRYFSISSSLSFCLLRSSSRRVIL